ncbi:hypothetical protein C8R43DRAFT_1101162 [Mycena crocata]|nr:hypothetical protein C8R43DRAFT_1101162 [Mycena crocata]
MFFSASIAFTFFLSLTGVVHGAPMSAKRVATVELQVCTGIAGSGTCTPLNLVEGFDGGSTNDPAACTNVQDPKSLIMDLEHVCTAFEFADCSVGDSFARGVFPSDAITQDLPAGIKSFACTHVEGLVDGLFPQDIGVDRSD